MSNLRKRCAQSIHTLTANSTVYTPLSVFAYFSFKPLRLLSISISLFLILFYF